MRDGSTVVIKEKQNVMGYKVYFVLLLYPYFNSAHLFQFIWIKRFYDNF